METTIVILISLVIALLIITGSILTHYKNKVKNISQSLKECDACCNNYKRCVDDYKHELNNRDKVYKEDITHWINMYNDVKNKLDERVAASTNISVDNKPASVDITNDNLTDKVADAKPAKTKKAVKKTNKKSNKDNKK